MALLSMAYNILCGGTCLEDLEPRRCDDASLDALGAKRVPDPSAAGDFCRRFDAPVIQTLINAINAVRVKVWKEQPESFRDQAVIDADGTIAPTSGECQQGMDISYKGDLGYHPLPVSLANTAEPRSSRTRQGDDEKALRVHLFEG